jgi:hypothetical protein
MAATAWRRPSGERRGRGSEAAGGDVAVGDGAGGGFGDVDVAALGGDVGGAGEAADGDGGAGSWMVTSTEPVLPSS